MRIWLKATSFSARTPERATGDDIFRVTDQYFRENELQWKDCTDGAPIMMGKMKDFVAKVRDVNPETGFDRPYSSRGCCCSGFAWCSIDCVRCSYCHNVITSQCLLYQPRMINDDDYGAVGGMRVGRGNRSTRKKPAPVPLCPPQIPHDLTWDRTRDAAVGSQRLTAWAMARPVCTINRILGSVPTANTGKHAQRSFWHLLTISWVN
jgi:hypothetical protein